MLPADGSKGTGSRNSLSRKRPWNTLVDTELIHFGELAFLALSISADLIHWLCAFVKLTRNFDAALKTVSYADAMASWNSKLGLGCALMLGLACGAGSAGAASVASTFKASVVITPVSACVISVTNMDFGTLAVVTGTETATSNVQVRCPQGVFLTASFQSTGLATTRNSAMTGPGGAKINFSMSLAGWFGFGLGNTPLTTVITGKLAPTASPQSGIYSSVETLYVIY